MVIPVGRRALLAWLAALPLARPPAARAAAALHVAVLDWGLAETCLALGCVPAGVPAPAWYDRYAVEPPMPPTVPDVGLLFTPNLELLQDLAPDAVLISPLLALLRGHLERIAPVIVASLFSPAPDAYRRAQMETRRLAERLNLSAAGDALAADCDETLAWARDALSGYDGRPLYVLSVLDDRHVNIFGRHSLHHDVLLHLGLRNAWDAGGLTGGEFATVGVERLADVPEARIIAITPGGGSRLGAITSSSLWQALAPVRAGRVLSVPPVLGSGGLPAARRLARLLAAALGQGPARDARP